MATISIFAIVCITLFLLLGMFLIISRKGDIYANRLLGIFLLLWGIEFLDGQLILNGFYQEYPHLALWTDPFALLFGPLIFFYSKRVTNSSYRFTAKEFKHLIPYTLVFGLLIWVYHSKSRVAKEAILTEITSLEMPIESYFVFTLVHLHILSYIFLSKYRLKTFIANVEQYYSQHQLSILKVLLNALLVVICVSIINSFLQLQAYQEYMEYGILVLLIITGVFLSWIIIKALEQSPLFLPQEIRNKSNSYTLKENEGELIAEKITKVLEEESLYLKPELTLSDLSTAIDANSRKVSKTINETMKSSFFELINSYRIAAAKQVFEENTDPKLTVLEVMYTVGFNSKSSFNTQFKHITGKTPSEFLKTKK